MKTTRWVLAIPAVAVSVLSGCAEAPPARETVVVPPPPPAVVVSRPAPAPAVAAVPVAYSGEQPAAPASASGQLSPSAEEMVRLAQSGTSEEVMLAYVQNAGTPFDLSADGILYLKDVGLSSEVITAMLNRDKALREQGQSAAAVQAPPPPATAPLTPPASAAPAYVSSAPPDVGYFYNDLSPYGAWIDLPGYGWCWQPTIVVVNRTWRPYCDGGHWVYSDCGWYWASDYSWGWAPFHYGRWTLASCGWVWCPDRVWGPAWVTWRTSGDYCGWAPLPPRAVLDVGFGWRFNGLRVGVDFDFGLRPNHFVFVGLGNFCDRDLNRRYIPHAEVTRIYNRTTIINNYTVVNNTTIINHGVNVQRVSAATHTQIRRATVRDLPAGSGTITQVRERESERSGRLEVYRAPLRAPARPAKMVAQKVDERHPVVRHDVAPIKVEQRGATTVRGVDRPATTTRATRPETTATPARTPQGRTTPSRPEPAISTPRPTAPAETPPARTARPSEPPKKAEPRSASVPETPRNSRSVKAAEPRPAAVAPLTPGPSVEVPRSSARSTPGYPADERAPRAYPQPPGLRGEAPPGRNPHVYYPKSYYQSSDVRALPPVKGSSGRESSSSDQGSDSRGKKHDR